MELNHYLTALAAVGTILTAVSVVVIKPWLNLRKRARDEKRATEASIAAVQQDVIDRDKAIRADLKSAITDAVNGVGEQIAHVMRECNANLEKHTAEDSKKHGELFDQNRKLIGEVSRIGGMMEAIAAEKRP